MNCDEELIINYFRILLNWEMFWYKKKKKINYVKSLLRVLELNWYVLKIIKDLFKYFDVWFYYLYIEGWRLFGWGIGG